MNGRLDAKPRFQRLIKVPNGNTGQKSPIINAAILINDFDFARAPLSPIRSQKGRRVFGRPAPKDQTAFTWCIVSWIARYISGVVTGGVGRFSVLVTASRVTQSHRRMRAA